MKINLNDSNIFKKVMLLFTVLISTVLYSQTYPVQVTPQLIPPYSLKISDYATTTSEKLYANILLTDVNEVGRRIRLKMYIEGKGLSITTRDVIAGETPIYLDGGINLRLSNLDLQAYFQLNNLVGITPGQYNAPLPNGGYDFCFEVYDYFTNRKLSSKSCTTVYLLQNDPPILNLPFKNNIVNTTNPQNVLFTWTPRHSNVSNVQYEFTLKELWDLQNPQANFLASVPFYQTNTYTTTLLVGPEAPQLLSGKIYGWQVRAFVSDGVNETSVFKNDGKSEIFWFKYLEDCKPPSFVISQALTAESVQVNWQSSEHLRYRIQYRKKGFGDDDWFEVNSYTNEGKIRNLEAATIYEFRVGGECTQLSGFAYSNIQEFTTPSNDEAAYYNCGLTPQINITNKEPLPKLGINETFTAGDFPVITREVTGSNGTFSGWGYITLPFLENLKEIIDAANIATGGEVNIGKYTRIKVVFDNVQVNSSYELIDGVVVTDYDPEWGGIIDGDEVIEDVGDLVDDIFPDEPVEESSDTTNSDTTTGENPTTGDSTDNNSTPDTNNSDTTDTTNTDITNQGDNTSTGTSSGTDTTNNTESDTNTTNNSSNNESEKAVIEHNGKNYKNGDIIEVPYSREQTNFAFLLKNYPKEAKINWQVLKLGTDNTSDFATNETIHDNFGIDMKDIHVLDIVANYNNDKVKVTIKRVPEDFVLNDLIVKDGTSRLAHEGQTLYLLNPKEISSASKSLRFDAVIKPYLDKNKLSSQSIVWYYEKPNTQTSLGKNFGEKFLQLNVKENSNLLNYRVEAGTPDKNELEVNVKWVDSYRRTEEFIPPAVTSVMEMVFDGITKINDYLPSKVEVKPNLAITSEAFNEEVKDSRFIKDVQQGAVNASVNASVELMMPPPLSVNLWAIGKLGVYFEFSANLAVEYQIIREKLMHEVTFGSSKDNFVVSGGVCGAIGAKVELLPGIDIEGFKASLAAYGKTCMVIEFDYIEDKGILKYEIYWNPLIGGYNATIEAASYELLNVSGEKYFFSRVDGAKGEIRLR